MSMFETLPFSTVYSGLYALVITFALGLIYYAMDARKKSEGTPINTMLLRVIGGVAGAFWLTSVGTFITQA
ncbi:MAG: hypothetical protein A2516_07990 [Alphaproteobacteria bacterium RIFOXYD12_FULL_60_8]|nr:MAG: hypothetical protein A2516_07990 [Alphaproteobacteria bacterium RIFOXYD12_FULL_60_8]